MNKKFLSAILFGALMVTATGTFVSCKDYDDDIDRIDTELGEIKSQLSALQTKVDAGKYVTNVATTADGITITLSDGTSYPITNGKDGDKGEAGAAGDKVEINEDGFFIINGKATEWKAVAKDATGQAVKIKTPTVSEDGCWVFYDEKGEAHPTTIKVAPVTAVQNADKSYTLSIYAADGTSQSIKLPTAATMLTEIVVAPVENTISGATAKVEVSAYTFVKPSKWDGPRALVANDSKVYAVSSLDIRVNPVAVDIADVPFTLVNTKNATFPQIEYKATAESGDNALDFSDINGRAANTGNGLWSLDMQSFILSSSEATTFATALANADNIAYAVTAGTETRSLYTVAITSGTAKALTAVEVRNMDSSTANLAPSSPTVKSITVDVNKTYTIDPVDAEAFYDMYFTVSELDRKTYDIVYDNEARTFTVRNKPDVVTTTLYFPLTITTLDNSGSIKVAQYRVNLSSTIDTPASYSAVTYDIANLYNSSSNDDYFNIDLDILKNALGNNYITWGNNVSLSNTGYYIGEKADGSDKVALAAATHPLTTSILTANNAVTTDVNTAKNIRVAVGKTVTGTPALVLDKQYYMTVVFNTAAPVSAINSIVIPVTFTAPSVASQFTPKSGYVVNNTINAYYYNVADIPATATTGAIGKKEIELPRYFDAMDINATLGLKNDDAVKKVGSTTYDSDDLATLTAAVTTQPTKAATLTLNIGGASSAGVEIGYGETLTVNANNAYYKDSKWAYSTSSKKSTSFTIKIMSPIYEGTVKPAEGSTIKISANSTKGFDVTKSMITGVDYNKNPYNVVPDKDVTSDPANTAANTVEAWDNEQIKNVYVTKKGGDSNTYIKSIALIGQKAKTASADAVTGAINIKADPLPNEQETAIVVNVTDAWGYTTSKEVSVTILKNN